MHRYTCRCDGICTRAPCATGRGHHSASLSDRHDSIPAAAPCLKSAQHQLSMRAPRRTSGLYTFCRSAKRAHARRRHGMHAFARSRPLRSHGAARQRRSAHPAPCVPVGGADAATAWNAGAKGGWASADIPVSQHCEGLVYGLASPLPRRRLRAAATARRPQDVSPHATCSIVPRSRPGTRVPPPMPPSPRAPSARLRSVGRAARPVLAGAFDPGGGVRRCRRRWCGAPGGVCTRVSRARTCPSPSSHRPFPPGAALLRAYMHAC